MNFSIIISNTKRSILYLKKLKLNNLTPNEIIYMDNKFDKEVSYFLKKKKILLSIKKN